MTCGYVLLQMSTQLQSVHHRHHHVCNHKIRLIILHHLQCLLAVSCKHYVEYLCQSVVHICPDLLIVFCNQQSAPFLVFRIFQFQDFTLGVKDIHFLRIGGMSLRSLLSFEFFN